MKVRYQALAPLLAGEGSRAFLGLEIGAENRARPVVLIWAPEESALDEERKAALLRETERAATLLHPNIIRVHGLAQMEDGLARVVEYADGESLRRVLEVTRTLPPDFAAFVAAECASGLHFAHVAGGADGKPWVHGDLRPETVLVSFSGTCKVTGYGALPVAPRELYGKRVPGRRTHAAPEQVLGGRQAATVETDVYLLGILLYECLTGQIPFGEEKNFDMAVVSQPLPHANYETIPLSLVEVIHKATAKKVQDRYASAAAFRQAVEQAMGILPTSEDLAAYLRRHLPENEPTRAARRLVVESAIADLARRQWEQKEPEGLAQPVKIPDMEPPAPVAAPAAPPSPPGPPVAPVPAAAAPPARPGGSRWVVPAVVAASLAFGASGLIFGLSRPSASPVTSAPPPVPSAPVVAAVAPPPVAPSAVPAPSPVPASAVLPSAPASAEPGQLTLTVTPPVDVTVEGRKLGRTPLTAALPNGRHTLKLTNPELGISVSKTVNVSGKVKHELTLAKGTVMVSAPDGATVVLDGKTVGTAPLKELEAYEGQHRIQVTLGKARYAQPFSLRPSETMYITVEMTPQE
jgi:serine/threonine-protein kinase